MDFIITADNNNASACDPVAAQWPPPRPRQWLRVVTVSVRRRAELKRERESVRGSSASGRLEENFGADLAPERKIDRYRSPLSSTLGAAAIRPTTAHKGGMREMR